MGAKASSGDFVLSVVGAVISGFLAATFLHMPDVVNGIIVTSIAVALLGEVILVGLPRLISPRRRAF